VAAGIPDKFLVSLDPEEITAGGSSQVACDIQDKSGNSLDVSWVVEAPDDIQVDGTKITTTVAGQYQIKCAPADGSEAPNQTSATLTVNPGEPVEMLVSGKPLKDAYCMGDTVTITHDMVDQYGNPVDEVEIHPVEASPSDTVELTNGVDKFKFLQEGMVNFHVESMEGGLTGHVSLLADCTGPTILITYPNRGKTLTGSPNIVVTGQVTDAVSGVESFTMNGEAVELTADGYFQYPVNLVSFMNLFSADAVDGAGNEKKAFRSCFYSTTFNLPDFNDIAAGMIDQGLTAFMSDEFFDDGDHSLPANDLATILEQTLAGFDLTGLLPNNTFQLMEGCTVTLNDITIDPPQIGLEPVDGGLHMTATIPNLWIDMGISCCYQLPYEGEYCDDYYAYPTADAIAIAAFIFIDIPSPGQVDAGLGPMDMDLVNFKVNGFGMTGNLLDTFINFLVTTFKDQLLQQVQDQFGAQIPQMIEQALASLQEGLTFPLPVLMGSGPETPLKLGLLISLLQFTYDGLELHGDLSASTETDISHDNLGAVAWDNCGMPGGDLFTLPQSHPVEMGLAIDFLNELLWSVWNSGYLQFDLTQDDLATIDLSSYGVSNLALQTDFYYAPVASVCNVEDGAMIDLQIGDLYVHFELDIMGMHWDVGMFVFLQIGANLSIVENESGDTEIGIELLGMDNMETQIVSVNDVLIGKEAMVESLIKDTLIPQLAGSLGDGLSFALPQVDLSTLAPGIPEGTVLNLDIQDLTLTQGTLFLGGGLK